MMKKNVLAMGLALTMALGLTACGGNSSSSANSGAASGSASQNDASASAPTVEKLVLGTSADYPPFEFHVLDENGKDIIVGIDVFLGEQIAKDMGAEFEVVHMDFNNLFTLLNQGQCDMVIAAAEIDEEGVRPAAADYSDGYYSDLPPKIVVRAGEEGNYTSLEDFSGKAVGAQTATTKETIVTKYMTGADLVSMSSVIDLVNNLVYDKCDALVLDGAVADQYLASNSNLAAVDIDMSSYVEPYRVWVAKGDPKGLLPSINETIAKALSDGTMDGFIEKADELSSQALEG
ncbi:MAG: transporter substrate-binding domain-containing protein [Oscillospiraceae bacterium]|jgi:ABC-type amino acid transport substrate-binding protein|nr:transporter substrate-binding domain-containing protein [Oscillospiraceae bacterium]